MQPKTGDRRIRYAPPRKPQPPDDAEALTLDDGTPLQAVWAIAREILTQNQTELLQLRSLGYSSEDVGIILDLKPDHIRKLEARSLRRIEHARRDAR